MERMIFNILNIIIPFLLGLGIILKNSHKLPLYYLLGGFFIYTGFGEWFGLALMNRFDAEVNIFYYDNFNIPLGYLLQFLVFYLAITDKKGKKYIMVMGFLYLASFLVDKIWIHYSPGELSMLSYCAGSVFCILICLLYMYSLIKSKAILYFKTNLMFWISAGTLFFQLFTFVFYALMGIWKDYADIGMVYHTISMFCLYISYLFFATGVLWMTRR